MNISRIIKICIAFTLLCLPSMVSAKELISWSEHRTENFAVNHCVTIPGTRAIPKQCAPSKSVSYPCPSFAHPTKVCHHSISGLCTPVIPGTPNIKKCAHKNFGKFSVKSDGSVFTSNNKINVSNTISADLFGQHVVVPMSCSIVGPIKASVCSNLLMEGALVFSNKTGVTCKIVGRGVGGHNTPKITIPGAKANVCLDINIKVSGKTPTGFIGISIESGVDFGSATLAGQTMTLGKRSWNPTLYRARF